MHKILNSQLKPHLQLLDYLSICCNRKKHPFQDPTARDLHLGLSTMATERATTLARFRRGLVEVELEPQFD
jgi:hypothetical protein